MFTYGRIHFVLDEDPVKVVVKAELNGSLKEEAS
jgi:hypothetical protein